MKAEMEKFFEQQIANAKKNVADIEQQMVDAVDALARLEQSYELWKEAGRKGELRRTKPEPVPDATPMQPARHNVAPQIKAAIFNFGEGEQFTAREVFDAIPRNNLDYERTRPSISAWLQHFVGTKEVKKVDRGIYEVTAKGRRKK